MRKIEILAPAGSYETMVAAFNGGCDAVYVGGAMFGARAYANNFNEEELINAIEYVHLHGKQLFLTVNTLLKDKEIKESLYEYLKKPYEAGLDAVIVQDVGVMHFIHRHFPSLPIHASTQMTLTMAEGADLLRNYGVTRLVTSRELSLEEIKEIRSKTSLEIESFVHGALCYCYSGQCLMSSMLGGRSGNRGRCAQTCRMPYELKEVGKAISDRDKPFLLSPKDICTLTIIPELVEAGIDSFKIEGRMKRPEYAAFVASLYRKYVNLYQSLGKSGYEDYLKAHNKEFEQDIDNVMELYNRGNFSTGYYKSHNGKHMMFPERPNHNGVLVGHVESVSKNQVVIKLIKEVFPQDVVEIRGKRQEKYEFTLKNGAISGSRITSNYKFGMHFTKGDLVYRTKNQHLLEDIQEKYLLHNRKVPVDMMFEAKENCPMKLTVRCRNYSCSVEGQTVQAANKQAATKENVEKQLKKLNETAFVLNQLEVVLKGQLFLPVSALNDLRREAIDTLKETIARSYRRKTEKNHEEEAGSKTDDLPENCIISPVREQSPGMIACVSNEEQLREAEAHKEITAIYYRMDQIDLLQGFYLGKTVKKEFYLVMPHVFRKEAYKLFRKQWQEIESTDVETITSGVKGFVIHSLEELIFAKTYFKDRFCLRLDYSMYTMNKEAKAFYKEQGITSFTAPLELNDKELKGLGIRDCDMIVYGHVPLMTSAQCLLKNAKVCTKKTGIYELKDRYDKNFIVSNYCKYCYNVIYNADPIVLLKHREEILSLAPDNLRLDFTVEKGEEVRKIIHTYVMSFYMGKEVEWNQKSFTKGHYKRGIE